MFNQRVYHPNAISSAMQIMKVTQIPHSYIKKWKLSFLYSGLLLHFPLDGTKNWFESLKYFLFYFSVTCCFILWGKMTQFYHNSLSYGYCYFSKHLLIIIYWTYFGAKPLERYLNKCATGFHLLSTSLSISISVYPSVSLSL